MLSETLAGRLVLRDVEPLVSANFFDKYFDMIVLPNCHPRFYYGWIAEIKDLVVRHPSLYYSMLACSAAQVHSLSGASQLHSLALEYYGRSLKYICQLPETESSASHNSLLMSIILLYLHGCLGNATLSDVPRHVNAAIGLLRVRFLTGDNTIRQPFDRIAFESVMYQIFLTATDSWIHAAQQDFYFDGDFWYQAELLLARSTLFPEDSPSMNSPILGLPVSLFRIVLSAKNIYQSGQEHDGNALIILKRELKDWETLVLSNKDPDYVASQTHLSHYRLYKDATYLYILVASLLIDQAKHWLPTKEAVLEPRASNSWQALMMVRILRNHQGDEEWAKCFISNWPLYTVGFFMQDDSEQAVVRQDLLLRVQVTGFSQAKRFLAELEETWARRKAENVLDDHV